MTYSHTCACSHLTRPADCVNGGEQTGTLRVAGAGRTWHPPRVGAVCQHTGRISLVLSARADLGPAGACEGGTVTDTGDRSNEELGNEVETTDAAASSAKTTLAPAPSQGDASETPSPEAWEASVLTGCASVDLTSLAPKFEPDQHDTYLRRLNSAVEDDKNRNIALTGRYGAGKSSVLDGFEKGSPGRRCVWRSPAWAPTRRARPSPTAYRRNSSSSSCTAPPLRH